MQCEFVDEICKYKDTTPHIKNLRTEIGFFF